MKTKDLKQECKCHCHTKQPCDLYCKENCIHCMPKQDRLRDKLERIVIDAQVEAMYEGFAKDSLEYVDKLVLLFQKYEKEKKCKCFLHDIKYGY